MADNPFDFDEGELDDVSFDTAEGAFDLETIPFVEGELPDNDNRIARGVDTLQATLGSAGIAIGELLNLDEFVVVE